MDKNIENGMEAIVAAIRLHSGGRYRQLRN